MFGMSYQQPIISSIRLENLEVSAQQAKNTAVSIKNDVQGLHDLTLQYRNDAQFYFEQVQQFQEGDYVTTLTFNNALAVFSFSDLASVPSEYNPSAHRHSWTELDDVPLTFTPSAHRHNWADLDGVPVEFEPAEHVHTWQQISGKPATFPPEIHVHDWSEIQNKPSAFMPVAHQHSWADITGKPSTYAPSAHTHEWTKIQNKPDVFHSGNSVNPLDCGLGGMAVSATNDDLNSIEQTKFAKIDSLVTANQPAGFGSRSSVLNINTGNDSGTQIALSCPSHSGDTAIAVRSFRDGTYKRWVNVHTKDSANEFKGNEAGDLISGNGTAFSAGLAIFYFRLVADSDPLSVTVSPDARFKVVRVYGNVTVAQGVTASQIGMVGLSSQGVGRVNVLGLSGLETGYLYELQAETAGSGIKFNF